MKRCEWAGGNTENTCLSLCGSELWLEVHVWDMSCYSACQSCRYSVVYHSVIIIYFVHHRSVKWCQWQSDTEWHRAQWVLWLTALHTPALWYFHALQMLSRLTCGETHLFWTQPFTLIHKTLDLTLVGSWDVLQRLYPSNRIPAVTGNTGAVLWCRPYRHIQAGAGHWVQA